MVGTNGRTFEGVNPDESPVNQGEYKGVDPVYQNHANETDAPLHDAKAVEAAEKKAAKEQEKAAEQSVQPADKAVNGDPDAQPSTDTATGDGEEKKDEGTPSTPQAPAAASAKK